MSMALVAKAQEKVELTRLQSGQLSFHRYTTLGGVRFVQEMSKDKGVTHISVEEFARAFHGTATKNTRKRAKQQLRYLIPILIEDGWLVVPEYADRELSGLVYVRSIPDDDAETVNDMIRERIEVAERRSELSAVRVNQLKANFQYVITIADDSSEAETNCDDSDQGGCSPAV